ncbi:MAG: phosphatidylglycerophosphatase A family protein [Acetobacteraceae bacterium]
MNRLIAEGFGLGRAPVAPGTVASAVALLLGAGLLRLPPPVLWAAILLAGLGGVAAIRGAGITGDPGSVVIDEVAGQWVALLGVPRPAGWGWLVAAFVLFRAFDILKPGPVGWADRRAGSCGVMGDDVIAGALAALLLVLARRVG